MKPPERWWGWFLSPLYHWVQVTAAAVQEALRGLFERWGLPARIRVDNGFPWSTWADVPAALALWWVGLGIKPIFNHVHCPKENAFVERCNGLIEPWGEPSACAHFADWQQKLCWVERTQREVYPAKEGKNRLEVYPALLHKERPYSMANEEKLWQIERAREYLGEGRWPRLVSKIGQVTVYGKAYSIGHKYAHQQVWLRLEAATNEWVVQQQDGTQIARRFAEQITSEAICGLKVAHPRPPSIKKKRHNLVARE